MSEKIYICIKCHCKSESLLCSLCQRYLKARLTARPVRTRIADMLRNREVDFVFHRLSWDSIGLTRIDDHEYIPCGALMLRPDGSYFILVHLLNIKKAYPDDESEQIKKICYVCSHESQHASLLYISERDANLDSPWLKKLLEDFL